MLKTYLCGSIQDIKDGGVAWRDKITPKLESLGIVVQNPCKSECNKEFGETIIESREQIKKFKKSGNWEAFDEHMGNVIRDDLKQVQDSNFIVVYWSNAYKHGGTIHEIVHAWQNHIPVYLVNYDPLTEMNDWVLGIVRQNGEVFENFGQTLDFIKDKYKSDIKDALKQQAEEKKKLEEAERKSEDKDNAKQ